eukprot:TRINITY_DN5083_c0_g1_i1.p2 TRINITY_DN5083_c0_g1~~TRINITY_DN5083_c0_g1_i1.p2  ORF type:complete len:205 (+),score=28.93 TRINITY_DN5083_c0_g1_i1:889-1503(+)
MMRLCLPLHHFAICCPIDEALSSNLCSKRLTENCSMQGKAWYHAYMSKTSGMDFYKELHQVKAADCWLTLFMEKAALQQLEISSAAYQDLWSERLSKSLDVLCTREAIGKQRMDADHAASSDVDQEYRGLDCYFLYEISQALLRWRFPVTPIQFIAQLLVLQLDAHVSKRTKSPQSFCTLAHIWIFNLIGLVSQRTLNPVFTEV